MDRLDFYQRVLTSEAIKNMPPEDAARIATALEDYKRLEAEIDRAKKIMTKQKKTILAMVGLK